MAKNEQGRLTVNQTKSNQIEPDQGRSRRLKGASGSKRRPFDQTWGGRTSNSVERVGCGEMLNG